MSAAAPQCSKHEALHARFVDLANFRYCPVSSRNQKKSREELCMIKLKVPDGDENRNEKGIPCTQVDDEQCRQH
jgi:hypothetical protein